MAKSYRAVQVSKPGLLEVVERELTAPPPGKVRIRVEACGVCHSDVLTVEGLAPEIHYPRVPGHEVVGKIDALGEGVSAWKVGQRVGVGFLAGYCGRCTPCREGDFVNCQNQPVSGVASDGGYAEVMIADAHALAAVPDALASAEAAPLLCAGADDVQRHPQRRRHGPAISWRSRASAASDTSGSNSPTAWVFVWPRLARGADKEELARTSGSPPLHRHQARRPGNRAAGAGGCESDSGHRAERQAMSRLIGGLRARGRMIVVGVGTDSIEVSPAQLVFGTRSVEGALTGSAIDAEAHAGVQPACRHPAENRNHAARGGRRGLRQDDEERGTVSDGSGHGPVTKSLVVQVSQRPEILR